MHQFENAYAYPIQPSGWVKTMGIVSIIFGGISCLSIFGAIFGVPMIIAGLKLLEAHKQMAAFANTNDQNQLAFAIQNYHKYFKITGIIWLISVILTILSLVFTVAMFVILGAQFFTAFSGMGL